MKEHIKIIIGFILTGIAWLLFTLSFIGVLGGKAQWIPVIIFSTFGLYISVVAPGLLGSKWFGRISFTVLLIISIILFIVD